MRKIRLAKPFADEGALDEIRRVLRSGWLTEGPKTREFEEAFKEELGVKHAIAVSSCTTGLELVLKSLELSGADEVIVPDYTYPASALAVYNAGAEPVLVDVNPNTCNSDFEHIREGWSEDTQAIMTVSQYGRPVEDYEAILRLKEDGVTIIEDAACSFGSEFMGRMVGTMADVSVFSFHPRKLLTTGEGGMIVTDDSNLADRIISLKHFGMEKTDDGMVFAHRGTNYKMSDILAAVGLSQFRNFDRLLGARLRQAQIYNHYLWNSRFVRLPAPLEGGSQNYQSYICMVRDPTIRDPLIKRMGERGIEVSPGQFALHTQPAFGDTPTSTDGDLENSLALSESVLVLPLHHEMSDNDISYVCNVLEEECGKLSQ